MERRIHLDPLIKADAEDSNAWPARPARSARPDLNGLENPSVLRADENSSTRFVGITSHQGILPKEMGCPIQIGETMFKLSGASIMSDAPSYFSKFFESQLQGKEGNGSLRTLFIDRDPEIFADIVRHLQGYFIEPRNGCHYVRLYADAQFYSLPRLVNQLYNSDICIYIGGKDFKIERELFSAPGNSPNYFTLGFAAFFHSPEEAFPGLDRVDLLRPPSMSPPCVPRRSAKTFAEILHLLRGYPLHIRDAEHRQELIRDCRYFNLNGLEQQIIPHEISFNVLRQKFEIAIRLENVRPSGVSFAPSADVIAAQGLEGWINYARPHVDEKSFELLVEIGDEAMKIDRTAMCAELFGTTKARMASLLQVIDGKASQSVLSSKLVPAASMAGSPDPSMTPSRKDRLKVSIDTTAHVMLNGLDHAVERDMNAESPPLKKRKYNGDKSEDEVWVIKKGLWRLKVQPQEMPQSGLEIVLCAVKLEASTQERGRNAMRSFLT